MNCVYIMALAILLMSKLLVLHMRFEVLMKRQLPTASLISQLTFPSQVHDAHCLTRLLLWYASPAALASTKITPKLLSTLPCLFYKHTLPIVKVKWCRAYRLQLSCPCLAVAATTHMLPPL